MIPRKLHYVWVGGPVPPSVQQYIDSWRIHNPDYELILWNDANIPLDISFIGEAYRSRKWAKVADAVRLWALLQSGGIYLDTDVKVVAPLDPLLSNSCFFGFQIKSHKTDWVNNAVFGAEPGHWFIRKAFDACIAPPTGLLKSVERPTQFGPKLVTRLLRAEGLESYGENGTLVKDIMIYPVDVFYPFSWDEDFTPECVTSRTLAIHFWEKNWQGSLPLFARLTSRLWNVIRQVMPSSSRQ